MVSLTSTSEEGYYFFLLLRYLYCLVLSCLVLSGLVSSCLVWSCLVLSGLVWSCLVLSCLVLSCLVWSCLVLSWLGLAWLGLACRSIGQIRNIGFSRSRRVVSFPVVSGIFLSVFLLRCVVLYCA